MWSNSYSVSYKTGGHVSCFELSIISSEGFLSAKSRKLFIVHGLFKIWSRLCANFFPISILSYLSLLVCSHADSRWFYLSGFWDICLHPNTIGVSGISLVVFKALKNEHPKSNSNVCLFSETEVRVSLEKPQTSLSSVNCFYWHYFFSWKCFQGGKKQITLLPFTAFNTINQNQFNSVLLYWRQKPKLSA